MKFFKKSIKKNEKGQVLVILALLVIGLLAIIGLAVDTGYMYVSYSRLRRAVDAAALAATGEFKRDFTLVKLQASAQQMLDLNGVQAADDGDGNPATTNTIKIEICATTPGDPVLCTTPPRKIVRVTVTEDVPTFFLAIIGFQKIPITITTTSEAATVDVVLLIDNSESMSWTAPLGDPERDPDYCNSLDPTGADGYDGDCHPFEEVKTAAKLFIDQLYFPYDRVGIVTYNQYATVNLPMNDTYSVVLNKIKGLSIFEGSGECLYNAAAPGYNNPATWQQPPPPYPVGVPLYQPCRLWTNTVANGGTFFYMDCPMSYGISPQSAYCGNTNTGEGFLYAGNALAGTYPTVPTVPVDPCAPGPCPPVRDDSVWVVIYLADGAPNSGFDDTGDPICPGYTQTYAYSNDAATMGQPCRDVNTNVRHVDTDLDYDADDYARDMVDFVAGNNTFIFSIGLGNIDLTRPPWLGDPPARAILEYAAATGGGDFYEAPTPAQLNAIFLAIANNIATRINQ